MTYCKDSNVTYWCRPEGTGIVHESKKNCFVITLVAVNILLTLIYYIHTIYSHQNVPTICLVSSVSCFKGALGKPVRHFLPRNADLCHRTRRSAFCLCVCADSRDCRVCEIRKSYSKLQLIPTIQDMSTCTQLSTDSVEYRYI